MISEPLLIDDKHACYERAVQCPAFTLRFLEQVYKQNFGTPLMKLREDFCGTALFATHFVGSHKHRLAVGVDLDLSVLAYAEKTHIAALSDDEKGRIRLMHADVQEAVFDEPFDFVDVVLAENFSYNVFHSELDLLRYFRFARSNLQDEGLMVLDVMGGAHLQKGAQLEVSTRGPLLVTWEQKGFDPISHRARFELYFSENGQKSAHSFSYDWRLWTLPELRHLLKQAGFNDVKTYFEVDDDKGKTYREHQTGCAREQFVALVVARR